MYCKKCNSEIPDSSKFCPKCGSPVGDSVQTEDTLQQEPSKGKNGEKHILRNTLITVIVCAVVVVLLIAFLPEVNSEDLTGNKKKAVAQSGIEAEYIEESTEERMAENPLEDEAEIAEAVDAESVEESGAEAVEESRGSFVPSEEYEFYSDPTQVSPRWYVSYYYSLVLDGAVDGQDIWDFFMADEAKDTLIESEYVNYWNVRNEKDPFLAYVSKSYGGDAESGRYSVQGTVIKESSGEGNTVDYIVIENGQYKVTNQN